MKWNGRNIGKRVAGIAAGLLIGLVFFEAAQAGERPNFLFLIVDDQSPFDLKAYDPQSTLDAPHIDRLAEEGMVFDGAHQMGAWTGGVCTPSRRMIMSGRTLWHIPDKRMPGNSPLSADPDYVPADLPAHTMAAVFNAAGYETMRTCKTGNSYEAANRLFTVRRDAMKRGGTDETGSAWHAEQVLDYLRQRKADKEEDPFLIYFGFSHPHDVRNGTPELLAKYGAVNHKDKNARPPANPKQPRLPASYLPAHPFDNTHLDVRDEVRVSGVWTNRDERTIRNELGREFACSENIDIQIGRVLEKLDAMGELDNTYVFYTSDHGIAIGRHGLQGKQNLYEHTFRVPFIVKGPGIKPGSRVRGNIYLLDILATLSDLAGIEPPETCDGISFKPVLEGRKEAVREVLYGAYCGGAKPGIRCVKKGDWKLIRYESSSDGVSETQLFNLADNPDELLRQHHDPAVIALTGNTPEPLQVNLAGDPEHAEKLREMEHLLLSEMRKHDDPYRFSNQPAAARASSGNEALLNVRDFGAKGDGKTLDSPSIQKAIDACSRQGGGEVLVPPGRYLCGTVLLKDRVTLRLDKGAAILGSKELKDYRNPDFFVDAVGQERGWCLIGIVDVKQAGIAGEGTIDGRGEDFRGKRPFLIRCVRSEDIRIEGVRLRNAAAWVTHLYQSKRVTVKDVDIRSHANKNNDGIDIDSSSKVLIEACTIDTGDDAVCIKATSPLPSRNITVKGCTLKSDWAAFKLGTESMGDFKDIRVSDCVIYDTKGGAMKILSVDGCRLEGLFIDNITVKNTDMLLFMRLGVRLNKYREKESRTPGYMKDVVISNIAASTSPEGRLHVPTGIVMLGEKTGARTHAIENVFIRNVDVILEGGGQLEDVGEIPERTRKNNYPEYIFFFGDKAKRIYPGYGIYARHVEGISFENVGITTRRPDSRPFAFLEDAHGVRLVVKTNPGNGKLLQKITSTDIEVSAFKQDMSQVAGGGGQKAAPQK